MTEGAAKVSQRLKDYVRDRDGNVSAPVSLVTSSPKIESLMQRLQENKFGDRVPTTFDALHFAVEALKFPIQTQLSIN